MATNSNEWWKPKPLTKEQMEAEIYYSQIRGPAHEEFTPEAIKATLEQLNLTGKKDGRPTERD